MSERRVLLTVRRGGVWSAAASGDDSSVEAVAAGEELGASLECPPWPSTGVFRISLCTTHKKHWVSLSLVYPLRADTKLRLLTRTREQQAEGSVHAL